MAKRKLYNGEYRDVDPQILLWRNRMRRREITLGKHSAKQKEKMAKQREARKAEGVAKASKKNFFGG